MKEALLAVFRPNANLNRIVLNPFFDEQDGAAIKRNFFCNHHSPS